MTALRTLTVDDEALARRRLKLLLQSMAFVDHVGEASSCSEALCAIATLRPDVVLLDIKMRDGDGFSVIDALTQQSNPPIIIFISAFDHYAMRAFDSAIADYLLKPVERDRLVRALRRASQQLRAANAEQRLIELQQVVRNLRAAANGQANSVYASEFWFKSASGRSRVSIDEIDCVSSEDDYIAVHTATGSHLMRGSIRQFEQRVEPGLFVRVHRRWLARCGAIVELRTPRLGVQEIVLRTGKRLPLGRVHLRQLRQALGSSLTST